MRRTVEVTLLVAAIAIAAYLRFHALADVSFWLDELAVDIASAAAHYPWWRWIAGFDPEHGPLFYASLLAGRVFSSPEFAGRVVAALAGVLSLPIGWLAARRLNASTAIVFLILLAVSPLHVYYSREARPYSLLMLFAVALIAATLLRARVLIVALIVVAIVETSAGGAPLLAAFAIGAGVAALLAKERKLAAYAAIACCGTAVIPLLYRGEAYDAHAYPAMTHAFVRGIVESLSVVALDTSTHHPASLVFLALAIAGAYALVRRDRANAAFVISLAILPALLSLAALHHLGHWYAPRYIATAIPGYLLLVAAGVAFLASFVKRADFAVATVLAIALASQELPAARLEPFQKLDWRRVARTVWSHAKYGDWVIATSPWVGRCLGHYLDDLPPRVRVIPNLPDMAAKWKGTWIVSAGPDPDPAWTCVYPIVYSDPLESLRVHYAPTLAHFLATRATPAERHDVAMASPRFALDLAPEDETFLIDGWSPADGAEDDHFRWVLGTRGTLFVPFDTQADRRMTIRVVPFDDVPQSMTVILNDTPLATLQLERGWHDYAVDTHAAQWRIAAANVITFAFARATRPIDVDPKNRDTRAFAAAFTTISFDDAVPVPRAYLVRLRDNGPPSSLKQAILDQSACLDDAAFVRLARSVLLGKTDRFGDLYFIQLLHHAPRKKVLDAISPGQLFTPGSISFRHFW